MKKIIIWFTAITCCLCILNVQPAQAAGSGYIVIDASNNTVIYEKKRICKNAHGQYNKGHDSNCSY